MFCKFGFTCILFAVLVSYSQCFEIDEAFMAELVRNQTEDTTEFLCKFMNKDDCDAVKNMSIPAYEDKDGEKVLVSAESADIAMFDACNPREVTIALPRHHDPDITVWPTCTRAKRCGGCCTSDVFSCEPTEIKPKYLRVFDTRLPYPGAHRFTFLGVRVVKVEEHRQCDAQCKTKPHECHKYQVYEARKCRCVCRPERLALKSRCDTRVQVWDDSECDCICPNRNTVTCPEPSYFSTTTCKCTLKTGVTGEIDLDKLFEQLDKGLIGSDILLKQEVDVGDTGIDLIAGGGEIGDDDMDDGNDVVEGSDGYSTTPSTTTTEEPTTTTTTTSTTSTTTTAKTTTTTPPETTTEKPCELTCRGAWKPRRLQNGKCQCFPPFFRG